MLASSLFVLSALTVTGVYVREINQSNNDDGYVVDFGQLENRTDSTGENATDIVIDNKQSELSLELQVIDDMDYDPAYREVHSTGVTNEAVSENDVPEVSDETMETKEEEKETALNETETIETIVTVKEPTFSFEEGESLQWPITGNVLLNYSMDKTIYFPTLQQYKYNPAIIIEATEGAMITASAAGEVVAVYEDAEIGQAVDIYIGNGYQLTYGQLKDIQVVTGDMVETGDIIGFVGEPSKYYSMEGSNVYFKLTKDGEVLNPLTKLE